ncbi:MAG TPA: septal ring lytic transglycosylase RlpA family protein [Stellaceae bacterium]|nr:septal ring lytic transglycosylase RlpA family protein [Stellaceae bacterium]
MINFRNCAGTLAIALVLAGCQAAAPPPPPQPPPPHVATGEVGFASWYKPERGMTRTATGERYDGDGLTGASRTLPLNSAARVTNLENGRSVVIRINDRGPYVRERILDVSPRAARALGMSDHGVVRVRVEPLTAEGASR